MMKKVKSGWLPAAAVSVAVHGVVFVCAAWALGAKKEYVPTELFRLRETPMVARQAQPATQTPVVERAPQPKPQPRKPVPAPEPAPVKPTPAEPVMAKEETPPPAPTPEVAPPPVAVAQNAPIAPPVESLPPAPAYQETDQLSNLPYFRTSVKPAYPRAALRSGRKARVVAEVFINEKGGVDDVRIAESGGGEFDAAVIAALKQALFEPGYMGGKAVAVRVRIPFNFKVS